MKLTANPALGFFHVWVGSSGAKLVRVMKLTTVIILAACLHSSANGIAQNTVTFSGKDVNLEMVFTAIKKQTSYRFFFNTSIIQNASKITLEVKNAPIEQVMNLALKDQSLTFAIKGRTIFVMKKPEEEKQSSQVMPLQGDPVTVSGRVTDEQGNPLVGANVKVKGTNNGVVTDAQGRFTLANVDGNGMLEVTFVGHETQLLPVKGKTEFTVALGQKVGVLDETVVIAYGTTTTRLNTGNVGAVKAKDIEKQPVNNPLLTLQGRVPGVFISQSTGLPNSGVTVRIQGQNSLRKGNDPLYVIDGLPFNSQLLSTVNSILGSSGGIVVNNVGSGSGNPLSFINPSEIESITVLKDADATSIYGSRAANGAIIITTKKGKAGKTKLDFVAQRGYGKVARSLKLLNTREYLDSRYEAMKNDGLSTIPSNYYDLTLWDTTRYTDWQKELIGKTANYTSLQTTISGGSATTQFLVSGGYKKETTVFPGDLNDQKGSLRFNLNNTSLNQKFKLSLSGSYLFDNNLLQAQDLTDKAIKLPPNAPAIFNGDGSLNWAPNASGSSTWDNPYAYVYTPYKNKIKNLISNATLSYQLTNDLEIKSSFGYTTLQSNEFQAVKMESRKPETRATATRSALYANSNMNIWIAEPQLNYKLNFGGGTLDALVGFTLQQNSSDLQQLRGSGYSSDLGLEDIKSASSVTVSSTINSKYKYNALFSRINYNLKNKYIINLNGRRDGSSRFGSENLFHNFGSVAAAWVFSKEGIIEKNFRFLNFGKLRASYGTTGNDQIGDYQFMNLYTPTTASVSYGGLAGLAPNGIPNPYLQWEETRKFQVGLDLGFISDRILFNLNFFSNRSSNQLLSYALPLTTGFSNISVYNFPAIIANTGWEISLSTTNIQTKDLNWTSSFNITIPRNKLVEFENISTSSYANTFVIGQSITSQRVCHYLGVNQQTGLYEVADQNGNATSNPDFTKDATAIINTDPKFYGGFSNSLQFKGFELDVLFQFVKQIGQNYIFGAYPGTAQNQPEYVLNRWRKSGDVADVQAYSTLSSSNSLNVILANTAATNSDASWSDASFIRLKNLSFSWHLPKKSTNKLKLDNCRLFIQGQNLLTITSYKGLDPETKSNTTLPPLRMMTFGLQISL